jgi:hypothetical protein
MRLPSLAAPLALVLALALASCGSDDAAPADSQGATQDGDSVALTVTREGGEFTPNGERVELEVDQTLVLTIDADEAGELHVHSTPEQEIEYDAGTSEHELVIDRPGVVEVESHEPDVVLLQLEVR